MSNYFARNRDEYDEGLPTEGQLLMLAKKLMLALAAALCLSVLIIFGGILLGARVADLREVIVGSLLAMLVGLLVVTAWRERRWRKVLAGLMLIIVILGIDQILQLVR